jgi:beta-N-acetylglucosaminidase
MKKVISFLIAAAVFGVSALGAYTVEIDDDTYVSNEVYFNLRPSWEKVKAERINLTEGKAVFYAGKQNEPFRINAAVMPLNTYDKTLTYKSEDESIASVDENGVVTPSGKVGDTIIDIRCGKALAKFKVRVIKGVEGISLSQSEMTLYADKPVTAQLQAIIKPEDATVKDVKWYSEDESIAFVDKEGLVYPCGVGTTSVYARSEDGGFEAACKVSVTTWEKRTESIPVTYKDYGITLDEFADMQMTVSPTIFTNGLYAAEREDVLEYANPENLTSGYDKYQFMDLGASNGIDAAALDLYLGGKGVLDGQGSAFKAAADANNLSEVYLVIHACLESGNGTSELASGIEYNGKTVYNLFGIGALDSAPVEGGAQYAYEHGWTSVEKAIRGGAEWISENYINNPSYKQNTLYKMRWNPNKPAQHQYATDIAWASKQARDMSGMFEAFPTASYHFEVPVFSGQKKPNFSGN